MSKGITLVDHSRGDTYPVATNDEAERLCEVLKNLKQGSFRSLTPDILRSPFKSVDDAKKAADVLGLKHFTVYDEDGDAAHRMENGARVDV